MKKVTLFFCSILFLSFNTYSQLAGNYTIDASLPAGSLNYQSFTAAVADLNATGVSGSVVFNVAPGVYNEQITIREIVGASSVKTITFDGNDSSIVQLVDAATGTGTIILDSSDYIIIQNMTVENTGTANAAILLGPGSNHNIISNNVLRVPSTGTNSSIPITFSGLLTATTTNFQNPTVASYNVIQDNRIVNGHFGIWMEANSSNPNVSNRILNNIIDSTRYNNIHAFYQDSLTVNGNIIDATNANNFTAVYLLDNSNIAFNKNNVDAASYGLVAQSTVNIEIINNMIISASSGLLLMSTDSSNIYHNSLLATSGSAVNIFASSGHDIRNNIFDGGSGLAFSSGDTSMFDHWDHNIYNTTGTTLVQVGSNGFTDLNSLQNAYPAFNASSLAGDPQFISTSDLHITYGSPLASSKGDNSVGVTSDIDGQSRPIPALSSVDIGADEFDAPALNASVTAVVEPSGKLCPGIFSPIIEVSNTAFDTILTLDIIYSINSQLDTIHYSDTIFPSGTQNITLNPINFVNNVLYDIVVYTDSPNGTNDAVPADDTLKFAIQTGLNGTYTIDASSPISATNYQSFAGAVYALNTFGVCGPVIFDIAAGVYNEAISLAEINGVDSANTVTFNGASSTSVYLVGTSSSQGAFTLDGADHIIIKNMTIRNTGTANSALLFESGSNYNTVSDCIIEVPQANISTATSSIALLIRSDASYNVIKNNQILYGYHGISIEGLTTAPNIHNQILYNGIDSAYSRNLSLNFQDSVEVIGNNIRALSTMSSSFVFGAYITNSVNTIFKKNDIISRTYGVLFQNFSIPTTSTKERKYEIVNNMIISTGYYGLWMQGIDSVNLFHNSISVGGFVPALSIENSSRNIADYDVRNNIFSGGSGLALETNVPDTIFIALDYNLYHSNGNDLFKIDGTSYADLAAYQSASPQFNDSSLQANPQFASPMDLHMVSQVVNNVGDNSVGVVEDIDGEPRPLGNDTIVDIGADEYYISNYDLAFANMIQPIESSDECYTSAEDVLIDITNLGLDSIDFNADSAVISLSVTGMVNNTFDTTIFNNLINSGSPLAPFGADTISILMGNIDMTNPGKYYFNTSITYNSDANNTNNSFLDSIVVPQPTGGIITGEDTICLGSNSLLIADSYIGGSLQWQYLDGRSWYDIVGADSSQVIVSPTTNTSYRMITCGLYNLPTDTIAIEVMSVTTPIANHVFDTVVCGDTGVVVIKAFSNNNNPKFNWYDVATGGSMISSGNNININSNGDSLTFSGKPIGSGFPIIDTFYVEEIVGRKGTVDSLTIVPYLGGSSCNGGNMFDVVGKVNLSVDGFLINSYTLGWQTVDVYMISGTYLNSISSTANWTLVESVNVFGNGSGFPSELRLTNHININTGDTVGIYIDYNANYTPVTMGTTYSNNDMDVIVGHAFCNPISLNPKPGNAFNGEILYTTGCVSSRTQVIATIECNITTTLEENKQSFSDIKILPNPNDGQFSISGNTLGDEVQINIYNTNGKLIKNIDSQVSNKFHQTVDLSNLSKGLYIIKFQSGSSIEMRKLIIK